MRKIILALLLCATLLATFALPASAEGEGEGAFLGHTADQDGNTLINLSELLRLIQFYNSSSFSCLDGTEDGYAPGAGPTDCVAHASDYAPQDWTINLSELLRLIQFFNSGGYVPCEEGEDGFCPAQSGEPDSPNVVFLILDTLRANHLFGMRNDEAIAPFMTGFAAQGTNFLNATSPSSWTRPSIAALFTGLYPDTLKGNEFTPREFRYNIPPSATTVGEWFSDIGYDCWAIQTNGNANAPQGFDQGFAEGRFQFKNFFPAALVTDAALETLPEWEEPFFSFVQYIDPHSPYSAPEEFDAVFGPQPSLSTIDEDLLSPMGFTNYLNNLFNAWANDTPPDFNTLSLNGLQAMNYRYDAEIRYLDEELDRLITAIETAYPNTIFAIVSDHGEALQDREELIGHGHTLFEEQVHVPLIFKGPGIPAQEISTRVEALGILPALATLIDSPLLPEWDATDPFVQAATPGPVFAHTLTFAGGTTAISGASVTMPDGLKLIQHSKFTARRLYDLEADPGETTDLAASRPADVTALGAILDAHIAEVAPE